MNILKHLIDSCKIVSSYSIGKVLGIFLKEEIYLISEREKEAEDNGYYLFKYIRENHSEVKCYYLIDKSSKSYKRIEKYGNAIQYNSFKHYIYYFLSKKHISAFQFFGVPNNSMIWFLEDRGFFKKDRIFLQHGITKEDLPFLKYEKTNYNLFICGAEPEYQYIRDTFGYPLENVVYSGFSRYDGLHAMNSNKKQILLMPTWRTWLGMSNLGNDKRVDYEKLINSEYYKHYNSLINSSELESILKRAGYELLFYLHPEAQRFREYFSTKNENIKIISREDVFLQDLLKTSEILITDYSSVGFEFGYMRKKMIYYQFDSEEYYKNHFKKGYFDAESCGFGDVVKTESELLESIQKLLENREMEKKYLDRAEQFFPLYDTNNSARIYNAIKNL
ncbi:CDP-glycerol glycerophosphotransferase family protein [Cetobacterium sp.]|uniref:CDP-glycerol glycerophosphotransferase family protein n=1 Tax=Cetobacterium sp. TaxID=2071632 RepID=UPI003F3A081A